MSEIWAEQALTGRGWQSNVRIRVNDAGEIAEVNSDSPPSGQRVDIALPAPANLHSHGFQRAMAGLTEVRSRSGRDTFWTWRTLMFNFISQLTPEDIEAITAFAQVEMLESGFAAVAEFHYVHRDPDGNRYDDIAELSKRIIAAAGQSGIGLTLLPVFYQYGGCGKRAPLPQQRRFVNDVDTYFSLFEEASAALAELAPDCRMGLAAHSLRAVDPSDVIELSEEKAGLPIHIHVAEQVREIEEFENEFGMRPVEWLNEHAEMNERWCLVHATHMNEKETREMAASGVVAGLCPITEANLGDGIFNGVDYVGQNGRFGVGTDSNIRISLCEELRTLEYSQRLHHRRRAALSQPGASSGRTLLESALTGGSLALGRPGGLLEPGNCADIIALDSSSAELADCRGDAILDNFVFAGDNRLVSDVWSAGRHVVRQGRHIRRDEIQNRFLQVRRRLLETL